MRRYLRRLVVGVIAMMVVGCHAITDTQLPDGVDGPSTYHNREGAMRLTQATRAEFATAIRDYIISSGLLTDELMALEGPGASQQSRDKRSGHWVGHPPHTVRALAGLARGIVGKYVSGDNAAWYAQLLMYAAYAEILIADGWCSGVPLSTLDFEGDWTYQPGSTTDEIYAHAILLLDSADVRAADSVSLQSTIRVLKARALLALGRYADAKQTVQSVDHDFRAEMRIAFYPEAQALATNRYDQFVLYASISDHEGINGLPYRSSGDPRTTAMQRINSRNQTVWFPAKYVTTDSSTFTLASGIEAQLILAEVALADHHPEQMLGILNGLRTTGTFTITTTPLPGGGERIDTLWHAGIGGIAGLRQIDGLPSTIEAQRTLLFAERAAWLFVTGHRQGDLRRLVRKYGLPREQVYPTGAYTVPGYTDVYGTDIAFGLSANEFINPRFTGCQYDD
jgi:hypothetical protein